MVIKKVKTLNNNKNGQHWLKHSQRALTRQNSYTCQTSQNQFGNNKLNYFLLYITRNRKTSGSRLGVYLVLQVTVHQPLIWIPGSR